MMLFFGGNPTSRDASFIYRSNEKRDSRNKNNNQKNFENFSVLSKKIGGRQKNSSLFRRTNPDILTAGHRTSVLTATVRGPTEEFQKKLRSNPRSASDLEDPAEKGPLRHKTADAPTYCWKTPRVGQKQQFWPLCVGGIAVLLQRCCFSAGKSKSDAE